MERTPAPETDHSVDRPSIDYEDLANWENEDAVNDVKPQDDDVDGYNDESIEQSQDGWRTSMPLRAAPGTSS